MKTIEVSKRIVKPENCALGIGIPISRESFFRDLELEHKEFAKQFKGIWKRYFQEVVCYIHEYEPILTRLGVNIVHRLTLKKFGELFLNENLDVIVLFSHWNNNAIEFHDGFATTSAIVEQIPSDFSGILDLCVCHPESLTVSLRKERPNCLIRYTNKPATPYIWLYFYLELFNHLKQNNVTYLEALEEVIKKFF